MYTWCHFPICCPPFQQNTKYWIFKTVTVTECNLLPIQLYDLFLSLLSSVFHKCLLLVYYTSGPSYFAFSLEPGPGMVNMVLFNYKVATLVVRPLNKHFFLCVSSLIWHIFVCCKNTVHRRQGGKIFLVSAQAVVICNEVINIVQTSGYPQNLLIHINFHSTLGDWENVFLKIILELNSFPAEIREDTEKKWFGYLPPLPRP